MRPLARPFALARLVHARVPTNKNWASVLQSNTLPRVAQWIRFVSVGVGGHAYTSFVIC